MRARMQAEREAKEGAARLAVHQQQQALIAYLFNSNRTKVD